jgi:hypothetical protein
MQPILQSSWWRLSPSSSRDGGHGTASDAGANAVALVIEDQ